MPACFSEQGGSQDEAARRRGKWPEKSVTYLTKMQERKRFIAEFARRLREARPGERVYMRVGDVFKDADIYSLDEWWPLAGLLSSVTMTDAKIRADDPSASCRNGYKPPDIVSAAPENINKCRCQMLKMPAAMAMCLTRLVDDRPGGHGSFDYRV